MARRVLAVSVIGVLLLMAAPAAAGGRDEAPRALIFEGSDVIEDAPNPCTNTFEDVVFEAKVVIREVDTEDAHHILFAATGTATQGAFSGPVATRFTDNGQGSLDSIEDHGTFSFTSHVAMRDGSGRTINNHFLFVFTIANGVPRADVDIFELKCVGKRA